MGQPFNPPLKIGEVRTAFPQLTIQRPLATGGQGSLFNVQYGSIRAVLKIYEDAYFVRAERECEALERIHSQYIVRLLERGRVSIRGADCIFSVTEYIEGECLKDRMARRRLSESEARRVGIDVASAINEMWTLDRIVHRDIKPSNIMWTTADSAVVIDLGIARHTQRTTITPWGMTLGTHGYMSPEHARGRQGLTYKSDFFSLGIVLYEALAPFHPFSGNQNLIGRIDPPVLSSTVPVSSDFSQTVEALLQQDPLDRPRDCTTLIRSLS